MILDRIATARRYAGLNPLFPAALDYLERTDFAALLPGRHAIDGDRLFALVNHEAGRGQAGAVLEAHQRYIDFQLSLDGREQIGWRPRSECQQVSQAYSQERDVEFYAERPTVWLPLGIGELLIFFPEDAHAPLAGDGPLAKLVLKIAVS